MLAHAHTHTTFNSRLSWTTGKDKSSLDLLEQETVSTVALAGPYANLHLASDR